MLFFRKKMLDYDPIRRFIDFKICFFRHFESTNLSAKPAFVSKKIFFANNIECTIFHQKTVEFLSPRSVIIVIIYRIRIIIFRPDKSLLSYY